MIEGLVYSVAERRIAQICEVLGLDAAYFHRAEGEKQARDGDADKILSEQGRRAVASLSQISDPLLRARLVELIVALADERAVNVPRSPF